MDIEFIYLDTMEALRPKLVLHRTFIDAARAVDERFEAGTSEPDCTYTLSLHISTFYH